MILINTDFCWHFLLIFAPFPPRLRPLVDSKWEPPLGEKTLCVLGPQHTDAPTKQSEPELALKKKQNWYQ